MAELKLKSNPPVGFSTLFFFLFFFISVLSYNPQGDRNGYMSKLKNALTPAPSDWSDNTYTCDWSGVSCDVSGFVDAISLYSRSLKGTIPSGLNSLSRLSKLYLGNNSLSGPLPSLANLTSLQVVGLNDNKFTSIPDDCFEGLTSLQFLNLSENNNLAPWTFPTHLTNSSLLTTLNLKATNLMGSLPDIFDSFPQLYVDLSKNNLTGVLPKSFARSKVSILWFNDQEGGG